MAAAVELTRQQVLAHRLAAHGLAPRPGGPGALPDALPPALLDLGVQDTPPGALELALSARGADPGGDPTAGGALSLAWSHRGAPHLHRTADLRAVAAACWPRDDADAAARLGWQRKRLAEVGGAARSAYRTVAEAVGAVLDRPLVKGELSSAVTAAVPAELAPYCRPCGAHHVAEQLLRVAALAGGARLQPGTKPVVVEPVPGWPGPPADDEAGTAAVQAAYLRLFAPATPADLAGFLGTTRVAVAPDHPRDLVPVRVDGRAGAVPAAQLDALRAAEPGDAVVLLGPSDPLLQGRDREVLVPEQEHRAEVWTALGQPGVVLSGVDVLGVWRPRRRGARLEVAVTAFRAPTRREVDGVEADAQRVAAARGARDAVVALTGPDDDAPRAR